MSADHGIEQITRKNVKRISRLESRLIAHSTYGERLADLLAKVVGSWTFLIVQAALLLIWMILNLVGWISAWDPYPFILLNLVLSFQSAFATPVILMSQNRQARLDERRNKLDLQINLLAEQENTEQLKILRRLCEKFGVEFSETDEQKFEQAVDPNKILKQINRESGEEI